MEALEVLVMDRRKAPYQVRMHMVGHRPLIIIALSLRELRRTTAAENKPVLEELIAKRANP